MNSIVPQWGFVRLQEAVTVTDKVHQKGNESSGFAGMRTRIEIACCVHLWVLLDK